MRTREAGRRQTNIIVSRKREHSRKPDQLYDVVERCSPGPYIELFARHARRGWCQWGNEVEEASPKCPQAPKDFRGVPTAKPIPVERVLFTRCAAEPSSVG